MTATSAESDRMSVMPRPSMRKWSVRMRWRTSFLVSERYAAPISFSRPSNFGPSSASSSALSSSVLSSRSCLPAMVSTCDSFSDARALHGLEHVGLVRREQRELAGLLRGGLGEALLRPRRAER